MHMNPERKSLHMIRIFISMAHFGLFFFSLFLNKKLNKIKKNKTARGEKS